MSYQYSNYEYTEMVRVLAKSGDKVVKARQEFANLFPNLPTPSRSLMLEVTRNLRENGNFLPKPEEVAEEIEPDEEAPQDAREREANRVYTSGQVPIPSGIGVPLGYLSNINLSLARYTIQDLQKLHQFLYGQLVADRFIMQNILKYRGQQWGSHHQWHRIKLQAANRMDASELKTLCEMLDLKTEGSEGTYSDFEAMVGGSGRSTISSNYTYGSYYNVTVDSDSSNGSLDFSTDEDREAEAKVIPDKKLSGPIFVEPNDGEMIVQSTRDDTASVVIGKKSDDENSQKCDSQYKRSKRLPTDDEIRRYLKRLLKVINLDKYSMDMVCRAVYNHYPEYELDYKKEFIKATVKLLLRHR